MFSSFGSLKSLGTEVKKDKFLWKGSLVSRMLPACPGLPPGQELHIHSEMGLFFFFLFSLKFLWGVEDGGKVIASSLNIQRLGIVGEGT